MVIFKKAIPRRAFLRGAGATLALPMLDAMTPAFAQSAKRPVRMAFIQCPNGIMNLKNDATTQKLTMRQRMEQHRANPACAVCHKQMDPLGFALENFDGLGSYRVSYGPGAPAIDASGTLPDNTPFQGPAGLRDVLMKKKDMFIETFTEQLMTYALGRGVEEYDHAALRKITRDAAKDNQKWSSIILGIVNSTPFQMRRVNDGNL